MRLLQNLLITNNVHMNMPGFFEKFIFELEVFSYIRMGLSLAKQLISPQKMFSILVFGSPVCTPLIPSQWTHPR